jgi:hypothetical protein
MGFFSNKVLNSNQSESTNISSDVNNLTKEEIALIINLIKQSSFQGEHIEILYNLVLKLQNQYLSLDK